MYVNLVYNFLDAQSQKETQNLKRFYKTFSIYKIKEVIYVILTLI